MKKNVGLLLVFISFFFSNTYAEEVKNELEIIGNWTGDFFRRDGSPIPFQLSIKENSMRYSMKSGEDWDKQDFVHITIFTSKDKNHANSYVIIVDDKDDVLRLQIHPDGRLTMHDGGETEVNGVLEKDQPDVKELKH